MTGPDETPPQPGAARQHGSMVFYTGAHQPHWLWRAGFPLFVSHRQLTRKRQLRPALARWALDSGGFTELSMHGRWTTPAEAYAGAVTRYAEHVGRLDFAAPQDWMCEPFMIERTGLSVREHQERTVASYLQLRRIAPALPYIPVLQGWRLADYLACADLYAAEGIDLAALPLVGLGSVCRRQSTGEIAAIVATFAQRGIRLHGFGVKTGGLHLTGTGRHPPTRWHGATAPAAAPRCPAAPATRTAPTASPTRPGGAPASWPATRRGAGNPACSMIRRARHDQRG